MRHVDEKTKEQIVELYLAGKEPKEISLIIGSVNKGYVSSVVKQKGLKPHHPELAVNHGARTQKRNAEIAELRDKGATISEIAEMYGLKKVSVIKIVSDHCTPKAELFAKRNAEIIAKFKSGVPKSDLQKEYKLSVGRINEIIREDGQVSPSIKRRNERNKAIVDEFIAGASVAELSHKYNLVHNTITNILHKSNIYSEPSGGTLCWQCDNACDGHKCPWVKNFTPIEGWDAEATQICSGGEFIDSYIIKSCPLFTEEERKIRKCTDADTDI